MIDLDLIAREALAVVAERFPRPEDGSADPDEIDVAIIDPITRRWGGVRAMRYRYPASVAKLFHLAFAQHEIERGRLADTPELRRAMSDMIVHSSNDGTSLVVDASTHTTGGPELSKREFAEWSRRRKRIDRFFHRRGYGPLVVRHKTYNEGAYGREMQGFCPDDTNPNSISPLDAAFLMADLTSGRVAARRRRAVFAFLARPDRFENQRLMFLTGELGPEYTVWSKAGWVREMRHDVARVRTPSGREWVIAAFSDGWRLVPDALPTLGREILDRLARAETDKDR